jgi:N-acetylglutamate synthase/N-acetylornithine aminotransferase
MSSEPMEKAFKDLRDSFLLMANAEKLRPRIRTEKDQASFEADVAEVTETLRRLMNRDQND